MMVLPGEHRPVAAMPASGAQPSVEQTMCKEVVSTKAIDRLFPVCFTASSPHCAICLSEIGAPEPCRKTTCKHEFHADCIMKWWTRETGKVLNCPTCRKVQKVAAGEARQVNIDTHQKDTLTTSQAGQRHGSQSQPLRQRQDKLQGPLGRLLESVRFALQKPLGTFSCPLKSCLNPCDLRCQNDWEQRLMEEGPQQYPLRRRKSQTTGLCRNNSRKKMAHRPFDLGISPAGCT